MASMRKRAKLKGKLSTLKAKNVEAANKDTLSPEFLATIGDEIIDATIEGVRTELAMTPHLRKLAEKNAKILEEFFIGYKEGVDSAIKEYIDDSNKNLSETLTKEVAPKVAPKEQPTVPGAPREKAPPPVVPAKKLATQEQVNEVLGRDRTFVQPKQSFAQKAGEFGITVLGDFFGADEFTRKKLEERRRKESFIQTESKLRPGTSRKQLEKDFKTINETEKGLKELEEQRTALTSQGYSPEQVEKVLNLEAKQKELLAKLSQSDPTRMGRFSQPEPVSTPYTAPKEKTKKSAPTEFAPKEKPNEEQQEEQLKLTKENLDQQEEQTRLLSEIKELLQRSSPAGGAAPGSAAAESSGGGILDTIDDVMDIAKGAGKKIRRGGRAIKRGAGNLFKSGAGALKKGASLFSQGLTKFGPTALKGAGVLAAGTAVYGGAKELAEGKAVENVSDVVPEGWEKINPFAWAMRGGAYVGDKINKGYSGVSKFLGGSGSLGTDVYEGVEKVKNFFGMGKPTAQNTKPQAAPASGEPVSKALAATPAATPVSNPATPKPATETKEEFTFSEMEFAKKDPENYKKFVEFKEKRETEIAKDLSGKYGNSGTAERLAGNAARIEARKEAITKFKKEIQAAGAISNATKTEPANSTNLEKVSPQGPTAQPATPQISVEGGRGLAAGPTAADWETAKPVELRKTAEGIFEPSNLEMMGTPKLEGLQDSKTLKLEPKNAAVKSISPMLSNPPTDTTAVDAAKEMAKNIVVKAPPATVIQSPSQPQMVPQPFHTNIRQNDSALSRYIFSF